MANTRCAFAIAAIAAASSLLGVAQDGPKTAILDRGQPTGRTLSGGEAHLFRLPLIAGEYAGVIVEQRGIDVFVQVLNPEGQLVATFDAESRKRGQEFIGIVADLTADYGLRVKARYPKEASGRYEVRVVDERQATDQDRLAFEAHKLEAEASDLEYHGKYEAAVPPYERALTLAEKAWGPDNAYIGELLLSLGSVKRRKGEYAAAEQLFLRAVTVSQKALGREDPQTALALRGLGRLYLYTNDYDKAEPLLEEQLAITERTLGREHPSMVSALGYLALLHQYRNDLERALSERQRAVEIGEKYLEADDVSLIAETSNLGDLYSLMGDNRRAEPVLERVLAMVEKKYGPEHPYVAVPLTNLGIIARENKEYARALELLRRSESIKEKTLGSRHPETATLLINIGNVYLDQGDYPRALELILRALEVLETAAGPYSDLTLAAIGDVARIYTLQREFPRAIEYQRRYEEVAEQNIALNLAAGSEREKLKYLSGSSSRTDRVISLSAREVPDNPTARELAAQVLLQRKGRLLDSVSSSVAALRQRLNAEDRKLLDDLVQNNAKLAELALGGPGKTPPDEYRNRIASLEEQREKLESALSLRNAEFRAQSQPVTLAAVQAAIPPGAALIEFAAYRPYDFLRDEDEAPEKTRYIAYVLRPDGEVQSRDLGLAREADDAITTLRKALSDPRRNDVYGLSRAVDRKITQPIRALIGDARQLLISPDGELNLIPFEALIDERGHWLVERYSISYLSAGRDLLRMRVPRASRGGPVVVADPLFGDPQAGLLTGADRPKMSSLSKRRSITTGEDLSSVYFAPLAGTAEEARTIKSLFPESEMLTGSEATESSLKKVDAPSILHIATHGFYLANRPADKVRPPNQPGGSGTRSIRANVKIENPLLRSGLALAGANLSQDGNDDGILTAMEASYLNLWGTKVVTLSACETGVGEVRNGEGVYGLRRAFFLAGAGTVMMSLWPVSDRVTREIMTTYYTGLKQGLGRGESLRQTQLSMLKRKNRQHPFYWASFIQSGDWRNLEGK